MRSTISERSPATQCFSLLLIGQVFRLTTSTDVYMKIRQHYRDCNVCVNCVALDTGATWHTSADSKCIPIQDANMTGSI